MGYENVKLWFAKNEDDRIVTIDEIEGKNSVYSCPVCGSCLKPKAIKSKQVTSHFAHVDASKCNSESQIHFWFKHRFIEKGDIFTIVSDKERQYVCKNILFEKEYEVDGKSYRPDVTILTECGNTIYFEMAFTNKKSVKDYLGIWLDLKNIVVEINIKSLMLKDSARNFKALFYNGKCFNTKKNDAYYNTIGKYKEEKLNGQFDKELKDRICKLDWFWNDVLKYKKGEVDIGYMIDLIDMLCKEDKDVIVEILKKQKCMNLYEESMNVKLEKYYDELSHYFNELYPYDFYCISKKGNDYGEDLLQPQIKFHSKGSTDYYAYEINEYTVSQIKNEIIKELNDKLINMREESTLEFAKRNEVIKSVISEIDLKYKNMDDKYHFYDRFVYGRFVSFCYNYHTLVDFKLPEEIVYSTNRNRIYNFIIAKIEQYMITVESFNNLSFIEETLNRIKEKYNNSIIAKEEIIHRIRVGKKKYKNKKEIKDIFVEVSYKSIAEDLVKIDIERKFNSLVHDHIFIYKDKLYTYYSDYKLLERIKTGELKPIKDITCFDKLEEYIIDIISLKIKNDLKRECVECDKNIEMSVGEINFFIDKGLLLPKRCKICRKKKKEK